MLAADFLVFSTILSAAWCNDMNISIPKTLNATSGSCLLIPCRFEISTENEKYLDLSPVVTWRRGSLWSLYDTERFTNAHSQTEPLIMVVGDLRKKNCTSVMMNLTSLHSDRYFLKFSSEGFSVTATKAMSIRVSDSVAEPYVIVPGLREGEVGNLTCTVPAPCPSNSPNVTWDPALGGNITQWTQLNADRTQNVSAILNFVPSFHHHELKVNCVSTRLDRQDKPLLSHKTIILHVEYPPKETQISVTGSVWLGNNVTLTCQSNANPPAVHRWFMKKEGIVEEVGASRMLSFTATHDNSGEYICEAQNLHGAGNSTILQINVPGISYTAFLTVLALFSLLLFGLPIVLIYRRCKKTHRSETNQDQDIYANVSSSATNSQNTYGNKETCTVNPECTFKKNLSYEDIYANC
ncbi:myelin-associated glycoprotein isoform X2 [Siphateles boraxobius]